MRKGSNKEKDGKIITGRNERENKRIQNQIKTGDGRGNGKMWEGKKRVVFN